MEEVKVKYNQGFIFLTILTMFILAWGISTVSLYNSNLSLAKCMKKKIRGIESSLQNIDEKLMSLEKKIEVKPVIEGGVK